MQSIHIRGAQLTLTGLSAMTFDEFMAAIKPQERPVLLLEGTRNVPEDDRAPVSCVGGQLARLLPHAVFRSGNAPGADQLFGAGVSGFSPWRLQYVTPYLSHRTKARNKAAAVFSLDQVGGSDLTALMDTTLEASPGYAGLIKRYQSTGRWDRYTIKLAYLLRDTLKVVGSPALNLRPAVCGIFYVNTSNPDSGGTGHTIRVCRICGVPVVDQNTWLGWDMYFF